MLFGKHINKYYLRYLYLFIFGLISLIAVDMAQLDIPQLYEYLVDGLNSLIDGSRKIIVDGTEVAFDFDFVLKYLCEPMMWIILVMVLGRFLWRICFFGAALRMETDLRLRMFDHCKDLSQQYYQVNKVGNLMSLFTNDIETVHECFGWGSMMLIDALFLGGMAIFKMFQVDWLMTLLSLIPMGCLLAVSLIVGKYMTKKWKVRQEAFSNLSDFSQEIFSGIAVIKAFVKELK